MTESATNTSHDLLSFGQAAALLPSRPSVHTVWRWCRKGVKARTGQRVHLDHVRFGGRVFIPRQAIEVFGRELAHADAAHFDATDEPTTLDPKPRSSARRQRDLAAAKARLAAMGV